MQPCNNERFHENKRTTNRHPKLVDANYHRTKQKFRNKDFPDVQEELPKTQKEWHRFAHVNKKKYH